MTIDIRADFEKWASTKDFYDTTRPYPFNLYARVEMQVAWIAWRDSYKKYMG